MQRRPGLTFTEVASSNADQDAPESVACPPHTTEAKLLRRIDLRVIPFLCIMYLLAFLDR